MPFGLLSNLNHWYFPSALGFDWQLTLKRGSSITHCCFLHCNFLSGHPRALQIQCLDGALPRPLTALSPSLAHFSAQPVLRVTIFLPLMRFLLTSMYINDPRGDLCILIHKSTQFIKILGMLRTTCFWIYHWNIYTQLLGTREVPPGASRYAI